jgi:hypothetical protein
MTDNEHEKSSGVAQILTETETPGNVPDKEPVIDQQMKRKIIKMGYWWLAYTAMVTLIILLTPESWIQWPTIKMIVAVVIYKMPYVHFLATISDYPEVVKFAYGVAWLSAPGHAAFSIATVVMSYMAGYTPQSKIEYAWAWWWIGPLFIWIMYFTCFGCNVPPSSKTLMAVSGRFVMAFLGQVLPVLAWVCVGTIIIVLLRRLGLVRK